MDRNFPSEGMFSEVFHQSNDAMFLISFASGSGKFIEVNQTACERLKYSREELLTLGVMDITDTQYSNEMQTKKQTIFSKDQLLTESTHVTKDGQKIPVEVNIRKFNLNGAPVVLAIARDITERKQAQTAMQKLWTRLNQAQRMAKLAYWEYDLLKNEAFWWSETHQFFSEHHSGAGIKNLESFLQNVHPNDREWVKACISKAFLGEYFDIEFGYTTDQKIETILHCQAEPICNESGQVVRLLGMVQDISDQKRAREALQQSEERYRLIAENSTDLITILDNKGNVEYTSPSHTSILGDVPRVLLNIVSGLIHPDDITYLMQKFSELWKVKQPSQVEYRIRHIDGHYIWLDSKYKPLLKENGEIECVIMVSRDITERKKMEEALHQSRERLTRAQQISHVGGWEYDLIHKETYTSSETCRIFGLIPGDSDLNSDLFWNRIHPDDRDFVKRAYKEIQNGKPFQLNYRIVLTDGTVRFIHSQTEVLQDKSGKTIQLIGTVQDITERKKTNELLQKADKLEAVGQLAAGVAHEIRNPLTAIKGFVELLQGGIQKPEYFNLIFEELDRIESIIREFLTLSKPRAANFQKKNMGQILGQILHLMNTHAVLKNIEIKSEVAADIPPVLCDENQIKQVFINLIKNAIEATPPGKKLTVQTFTTDNQEVLIRVIDEGCGIDADRQLRLFEPFYSTKESGTGLGLMISYKIIQEHKGMITVTSKQGEGTTVDVLLPISVSI